MPRASARPPLESVHLSSAGAAAVAFAHGWSARVASRRPNWSVRATLALCSNIARRLSGWHLARERRSARRHAPSASGSAPAPRPKRPSARRARRRSEPRGSASAHLSTGSALYTRMDRVNLAAKGRTSIGMPVYATNRAPSPETSTTLAADAPDHVLASTRVHEVIRPRRLGRDPYGGVLDCEAWPRRAYDPLVSPPAGRLRSSGGAAGAGGYSFSSRVAGAYAVDILRGPGWPVRWELPRNTLEIRRPHSFEVAVRISA
jgi:hypothetical protein